MIRPHLGSPRKIHRGQRIHSSLLLSDKPKYIPKARPLDGDPHFWEKGRTGLSDWLEIDLYEHTQTLVKNLITECPGRALQILRQTAKRGTATSILQIFCTTYIRWSLADGWQAVYEGVIKTLNGLEPRGKHLLLQYAMDILGQSAPGLTSLKLGRSIDILPLLSNLVESNLESHKMVMRRFLMEFTDCKRKLCSFTDEGLNASLDCVLVLDGHTDNVNSVMFSPDGSRIVSGSEDETVRVWNAETGKPLGEPFRGHTSCVYSVAFSPGGKRVFSGSTETFRIWDTETGKQMGKAFGEKEHSVLSVTFSPDGRHVASGYSDGAILICDAETRKQIGEPFRGHTDAVWSVTFSPDGKRVASGSNDQTVRIWDAEAGKPVGEPFQGHTNSIISVAFSPDGKRVVSGSYDKTIRIWDAEAGKPVGEPFQGHSNGIISVAFSPDGKRVVSGSWNETIWIWNVETGKQVGEPFSGHTDWVNSVAFSPDGKRVVSGSDDKTIRIWDVEAAESVAKL